MNGNSYQLNQPGAKGPGPRRGCLVVMQKLGEKLVRAVVTTWQSRETEQEKVEEFRRRG